MRTHAPRVQRRTAELIADRLRFSATTNVTPRARQSPVSLWANAFDPWLGVVEPPAGQGRAMPQASSWTGFLPEWDAKTRNDWRSEDAIVDAEYGRATADALGDRPGTDHIAGSDRVATTYPNRHLRHRATGKATHPSDAGSRMCCSAGYPGAAGISVHEAGVPPDVHGRGTGSIGSTARGHSSKRAAASGRRRWNRV